MNKKMLVTGIVAAGVLLGGTTIVGASMNNQQEPVVINEAKQTEEVVKTKNSEATKNMISAEEAREIALSEQDGYVEDIELESDDGYTFYEVEIENGDADYDIYVDAYTGEVLKIDADDHDDYDDGYNQKEAAGNMISAEQAKQMALETFGGKIVEFELDEDDGRYEYEIELKTKRGEAEMTIDAITGDILEQELDD